MTREPKSEVEPQPEADTPKSGRRATRTRAERRIARAKRHGRLGKGLISTVVLASFVLFLGGLILSDRAVPLPDSIRDRIAVSVSERLPDGAVKIGAVAVTLGRDLAPRVRLSNVSIGDTGGGGIAVLNGVTARLSPSGLLRGRFAAEHVVLNGAQVTLRRAADGAFALALLVACRGKRKAFRIF